MATLTMPTSPGFKTARFGLIANTRTFRSPTNRSAQTLELPGSIWSVEFGVAPMRGDGVDAAEWATFLTELMGEAGRFFGFDPKRTTPRGSNLGTPLVDGAAQTGKSLATKGWDATETGLLLRGDYFTVNDEYKKVTASVDSDGGGLATINFISPLRASPSDSAVITTTDPTAIMKLVGDNQGMWDENILIHGFSFSGEEVFI